MRYLCMEDKTTPRMNIQQLAEIIICRRISLINVGYTKTGQTEKNVPKRTRPWRRESPTVPVQVSQRFSWGRIKLGTDCMPRDGRTPTGMNVGPWRDVAKALTCVTNMICMSILIDPVSSQVPEYQTLAGLAGLLTSNCIMTVGGDIRFPRERMEEPSAFLCHDERRD